MSQGSYNSFSGFFRVFCIFPAIFCKIVEGEILQIVHGAVFPLKWVVLGISYMVSCTICYVSYI